MEQIFAIMAFVGGFLFLSMGLSLSNSIEAKESELVSKILTVLLVIGLAFFLIGFLGLLFCYFF
jgi:hypothetical protein